MSRIGRLPVVVPAGVTVEVKENNYVVVKGSKGTLERNLPVEMDIKVEDGQSLCNVNISSNDNKFHAVQPLRTLFYK